jgi:hypothetical protein
MTSSPYLAIAFGVALAAAPLALQADDLSTSGSGAAAGTDTSVRDDCVGQPGQTAAGMPATQHQIETLGGATPSATAGTGDIPATEHQEQVLQLPDASQQPESQSTGDVPATEHQQQALDLPQSGEPNTQLQDIQPSSGSATDCVGQPGDTVNGMPATEHQEKVLKEEPAGSAN